MSEREPEAPPAGGFGEQSGARFGPIRPDPPPPQSPAQRVFRTVMTLIGGAAAAFGVLVFIGGVFAVLMFMTRGRGDRRAAESRNTLGQIGKDASNTFEERGTLCPSARPVPAGQVRAPYTTRLEEWRSDPGWSCLGFEMTTPQAYRYEYESDSAGFTARATPMDGKDTIVREYRGRLVDGKLVLDTSISER